MNSVTYVLYSEDIEYCVLIDCGEYESLEPILSTIGKQVRTVLLTHGHFDHIYGLLDLLKAYPNVLIGTTTEGHEEIQDSRKNLSLYHGFPVKISDYQPLIIRGGQTIHFDRLSDIEVISTPGHDVSCLSYKIDNHLFTGDAYIPGIKTFTKFPRGNKEKALESIAKLSKLETNGCIIHCGHHLYTCK